MMVKLRGIFAGGKSVTFGAFRYRAPRIDFIIEHPP
jgi:hypothetical protein